jgi:hypothetical protein
MDPLSITAATIAVCRAGDQLFSLLSRTKLYFTATQDVEALTNEVANIKLALGGLNFAASPDSGSSPELCRLGTAIDVGIAHISQLEKLLAESLVVGERARGLKRSPVRRMAWVRKKSHVERIKQQLKDDLSAIQLHVVCLTL